MEKLVRNFFILVAIVGIVIAIIMNFYPNVVTGISPVRDPGKNAKEALQNVASAKDKDAALIAAVNQLPSEGSTLEEKVAHWVRYDFQKIDSMKFMLVSGVGISATDAKHKIHEGGTYHQVVVKIFSGGKCIEYFLECANGLVSKRWPKMVSEKAIGATRKVEHPIIVLEEDSLFSIEPGKSLCNYFSLEYALGIAMGLHLPSYADDSLHTKITSVKQGLRLSKHYKIIVLVYPGQMFARPSREELLSAGAWHQNAVEYTPLLK